MDITSNTTTTTTTAPSSNTVKNPEGEAETQTPIRIQPAKPLAFSNGVLKRHNSLQNHHGFTNNYYNNHYHHHHPVVVTYKECLKNHAASLGSHAVDGCGEFMPSPTANSTDPTSLKCAACGCHRNFHRREPEETLGLPPPPPPNITPALEYQPHHRHHPPPPPPHRSGDHSSPNSPSPPPISSAYYPASAPHMLLALSAGLGQPSPNSNPEHNHNPLISPISVQTNPNGRKRHRTKFTQLQKEEMLDFAEKVGWKMQKRDEDLTSEFCSKIGIEKGVLKVWMHNNKNTFGKKDMTATATATAAVTTTATTNNNHHNGNANGNISFGFMSRNNSNETNTVTGFHIHHHHERNNDVDKDLNHSHGHDHSHQFSAQVTTNGSSSSN